MISFGNRASSVLLVLAGALGSQGDGGSGAEGLDACTIEGFCPRPNKPLAVNGINADRSDLLQINFVQALGSGPTQSHFLDEHSSDPGSQYLGSHIEVSSPWQVSLPAALFPPYDDQRLKLLTELKIKLDSTESDVEKMILAYNLVSQWIQGPVHGYGNEAISAQTFAAPLLKDLLSEIEFKSGLSAQVITCYYHKSRGHYWVRVTVPGANDQETLRFDLDPSEHRDFTILGPRGYW